MNSYKPKIVVVGDGIAAMMSALAAAESGASVRLVSVAPQRRSRDVCLSDGLAGVLDGDEHDDSTEQHLKDTVLGGDFLAHQKPLLGLCDQAPGLIRMCARMGVLFSRTQEGNINQVMTGGMTRPRIAYAGAISGHQVVCALDEQVRRLDKQIERIEHAQFSGVIRDDRGACVGATAIDTRSLEVIAFSADAVIVCTGGYAGIYGASTFPASCSGAQAAQVYMQGACFANPEFVDFHPAAIAGMDKKRAVSGLAFAFGASLAIPHNNRVWRFVDEMHPKSSHNVPLDVATRETVRILDEMKLTVEGERAILVDFDSEQKKALFDELPELRDLCRIFAGTDPMKAPIKVVPAAHHSLGGLWVDNHHATTIPGLFAAGECEYQYHGAGSLGSNIIVAMLHAGRVAGVSAVHYAKGNERNAEGVPTSIVEREVDVQKAELNELLNRSEGENPRAIKSELAAIMDAHVGAVRDNALLDQADKAIAELVERYSKCCPADKTGYANEEIFVARNLLRELKLAQMIVRAAKMRDESRGSHYKPAFPARSDKKWGVITKAVYTKDGPKFDYSEKVDTSEFAPVPRVYE